MPIQLPNFIPDANPQGSGNPALGIISSDRPLIKRIPLPQIGVPHGTVPDQRAARTSRSPTATRTEFAKTRTLNPLRSLRTERVPAAIATAFSFDEASIPKAHSFSRLRT